MPRRPCKKKKKMFTRLSCWFFENEALGFALAKHVTMNFN